MIIRYKSFQVAAISGDARRALEICRRAAENTNYHIKNLGLTPYTDMNGIVLMLLGLVSQIF